MQFLFTAASLLVAGVLCSALLAAPVGQERPRLIRGSVWALWSASAIVAAGAICAGVVRLSGGASAKADIGEALWGIAVGVLIIFATVALLRLFGFWASLRRYGSCGKR